MRENAGDSGEKEIELFDDQTGGNADALRAAGKSLPPFQEFLRLCGLGPLATEREVEATSSESSQLYKDEMPHKDRQSIQPYMDICGIPTLSHCLI
ncbi:hypothetical protein F5Y09DRAFT_130439 [Xylaria sp. FL1042]|nr:hypothetical protein F5Y09DRAFT_130439 [Xylaria sp. FL1042]